MRPDPAAPTATALLGALPAAQRLDLVVGRAARIANLVATAPTAPVPSCPDWTAGDLARHVHRVLAWCTHALTHPSDAPPPRASGPRPDDAAVPRALLDQATITADVLRDLPDDVPVWTWAWGRAPAAFWHRRLVHELVVHAVDAELAVGLEPSAVAPAVAADGIDELLTTHALVRHGEPGFTSDEGDDLHVHLVDADVGEAPSEWHLRCTPDGAVVAHEHVKARVALRGPAHDVYLALWRRLPMDRVERLGSPDDVARWDARLAGLVL